jgi:argininosuccinate lyase
MTKIWNKGGQKNHPTIEKYTVGNDTKLDQNLVVYDCQASIAHAKMLGKIKILKKDEVAKLKKMLKQIIKFHQQENFKIKIEDEDGHTAIENFLTKKLGKVGKKIHTGRSRNDQVLVAVRLYTLDKLADIEKEVQQLIKNIEQKSQKNKKIKMPGYTHTQKAMPTTVGVWLGSFADALKDDLVLLFAAQKVVDQNPLGSVAGFGETSLGLNRNFTTKQLKFAKTQTNPIYCAYSRGKFENIVLQALSQIMLDLGKLANDLILFTTQEFNFFDLPDEFKTGSSVMPQKKNFDVLELIRGNTSIFLGYQFQIQGVIHNLISGYNRDFQLTKEPYLKAVDLFISTVEVSNLVVKNLKINKNKLESACTAELYATEVVYKLVKKGMPFRDAYRQVGNKFK